MTINNALYTDSGTTIGTTEYSLTNDSTTIASQTGDAIISIWIDFVNMAAGDEYEIALYEQVYSGGTQRRIILGNVVGAQPDPWVMHGLQVGNGWDVTLDRIAGSDRSISWTIRAVT